MKYCLLLLPFIILTEACNNNNHTGVSSNRPSGKDIAKLNSYLVEKDRERILSYAERRNLELKETGTGLWYMIRKDGSGIKLKDKDHIIMEYTCSLLDGTPCYSSDKLGPKDIILGRSEIEPGLYEGLKLLNRGSEAIFIIPPFLGFGLPGDGRAIPPRATLVYDVKIKEN